MRLTAPSEWLQAGLEPTLLGKGPYTIFAPNDDAFFQAAKDMGVSKVELVSLPQMADILKNHVLEGEVSHTETCSNVVILNI